MATQEFKTEEGKWFEPIIPQDSTVKIELRYFDNTKKIIEIPVKQDMLRNFDRIGWKVSLSQLRNYIPSGVLCYSIID